jgi:DNA-binding NtrC family response regulator
VKRVFQAETAGDRRGARVLVVDASASLRSAIATALGENFECVDGEASGTSAIARILDPKNPFYDLVISDLRPPGAEGIEVLKAALKRRRRTSVVMMTADGSVESAVEAMRLGATDFIQKPFDLGLLEYRVARALEGFDESTAVRDLPPRSTRTGEVLIAESPVMIRAVELARRVAESRSMVLISGETGAGKEVIAGLIHRLSPRCGEAFVKVNCAALPEMLLESELFGHERGAFTGAERRRTGRFEQASGGTLFLDEVGDMSPSTQAKLLRVLQDQEFYRVGGTELLRTDARIIAASNVDLVRAIREGRFRADLYFRLNVVGIHLAPLRERPEDTLALASHFLEELSQSLERPSPGFRASALKRIREHTWPGNVRELRNAIERAVLLSDAGPIDGAQLSLNSPCDGSRSGSWQFELPPDGVDLRTVERDLLIAALERTGFVQKEAARLLCVTPRKLNYMIQQLGVTHPSWRRNNRPTELVNREPSRLGTERVSEAGDGVESNSKG